jgi:hypothetical protein
LALPGIDFTAGTQDKESMIRTSSWKEIHVKTHKCLWLVCALITLTPLSLMFGTRAADSSTSPNPTGTWKWKFETQSGQTIESSVKLKLQEGKLTGTFVGRDGTETPIQNGKLNEDNISFTVVRERDGQKFTSQYTGKVAGDSIKGKIEMERDGQTRTRDWAAKREGGSVTGTWKWSFEIPNGQTLEPSAKLTQNGDKLTGVLMMNETERPISEGTIKDGEVNFKVMSRRDDRAVTSKYSGKVSGDTIKGKWSSDWSGDVVTRDWEAKRSKE